METLQQLTRRQIDALRSIGSEETPDHGVPLKVTAASLKVRPPSALGYLTPLESMGLIARYRGKSRLTPRGRSTLLEFQRHHRIAESLFGNLGLSPSEVCRAAQEVDLALSHLTIERLCDAEGHPSVCPHGEPIPPCSGQRGSA